MKRNDYLLLFLFGLVVYGVALVSGRPLTMHEAVLPECTREMHARGDWLTPTSGGRAWLHRPPLPHWTLLLLNLPHADINEAWQVRLGPLLTGLAVTLLSAWLAQRWFGRAVGLLTGFILATSFQFVRYTWLAEEDMFLCAVVTGAMACFAWLEVPAAGEAERPTRFTLLGPQPWPLLLFFVLLGLSNLAKGLIFGPLMILVPVGLYLLSTLRPARLGRYFWFWGLLIAVLIAGAWPVWTYLNHPDVLEMWRYDYGGRLSGGYVAEPWFYYLVVLLWALLPWTPAVFIGLWTTAPKLKSEPPVRFLWCWGVGILAFFSIPDGKHHHYFIHCLPAWAMLAALGTKRTWEWLSLRLPSLKPWPTGAATFATFGAVFIALHLVFAYGTDESLNDAAFLKEAPQRLEPGVPLLVNAELRSCLEVNRILFDLDRSAQAIHNLTFLLDEKRTEPKVYLLTQAKDEKPLRALGEVRRLAQSERSRREAHPGQRLTLFELAFAPDLPRHSAAVYIEQQQIKHRKPGPYLGGKAPSEWSVSLSRRAPQPDTAITPASHVQAGGR